MHSRSRSRCRSAFSSRRLSATSATKSTDVDGIGRVVDVGPWDPGETMAWVRAELDRRERYLDLIRARLRAGLFRMTAASLRAFGFDEDEIARLTGAELTPRTALRAVQPAAGAFKAASELQAMIDRTGHRTPLDSQIKAIASAAAERYAETGDLDAAVDGILRAVRNSRKALPIDPDAGLPIVGSS